jgi:hypothetical protein
MVVASLLILAYGYPRQSYLFGIYEVCIPLYYAGNTPVDR